MIFLLRVISRLTALTCIFLSLSIAAQEEQRQLYFDVDSVGGWVPILTAAEPGNPGIMTEITQAMERHLGIEFIPIKLPQKRAEIALKEGFVDIEFKKRFAYYIF